MSTPSSAPPSPNKIIWTAPNPDVYNLWLKKVKPGDTLETREGLVGGEYLEMNINPAFSLEQNLAAFEEYYQEFLKLNGRTSPEK